MCWSDNVYYPCHEEYVGPRSDMKGLCVRCHEAVDPNSAAAIRLAKAADWRRQEEAERRMAEKGEEEEEMD